MDFYLVVMNFVTQLGMESEQAIAEFGDAQEIKTFTSIYSVCFLHLFLNNSIINRKNP